MSPLLTTAVEPVADSNAVPVLQVEALYSGTSGIYTLSPNCFTIRISDSGYRP